jgi:prepilin-type N-terminal cleavage/methylation domain-containing protein/prepilin-type processing-associated H-X9-DG protein
MNRRAFTLIELLVVIAIIAILAAILFPVFAQAKLAAKKSSDLSSVKQITLAQMMYLADYDDVFVGQNNDEGGFPIPWNLGSDDHWPPVIAPPIPLGFMDPRWPQSWARETMPYMKSLPIFVSVAAPRDPSPIWGYSNAPGAGNNTWVMNGAIQKQSHTNISAPADLVLFQSSLTTTKESLTQPARLFQTICNGIDLSFLGNTFGQGANYGWADGHASYKQRTGITFRNMGISGVVNDHGPTGQSNLPNTTSLTNPNVNPNYWWTWGECNLASL